MAELNITDPFLRRLACIGGVLGVVLLFLHILSLLKDVLLLLIGALTPFLLALVIAYLLAPLVIAVERRLKFGRIGGTLFVYLAFFTLLAVFLFLVIPEVLSQMVDLGAVLKKSLPNLVNKLSQIRYFQGQSEAFQAFQDWIHQVEIDYSRILTSFLQFLEKIASGGFAAAKGVAQEIFGGIGFLIKFFLFLVFIGIINFYLILDWERIQPFLRNLLPPGHRDTAMGLLARTDASVGGFLRGQLIVAALVGLLFAAGLFGLGFIGFPTLSQYSAFIGTLAGIAGLVPYLGAVIGVAPAILIVLLTGGVSWLTKLIALISVIGLFSLIQMLEGFVLQPKIVGKGAGLHPLAVMLALMVGAQFGIAGMMVAVPFAAVIRVFIREFYLDRLKTGNQGQ